MLCSRGSSMKRFVLTGAKYDAQPLVTALREGLGGAGLACEDAMIDAALDAARPATAIVATLSSERPLKPYVFRSYQVTSETRVSLCPARTKGLWSSSAGGRQQPMAPSLSRQETCGNKSKKPVIAARSRTHGGTHAVAHTWWRPRAAGCGRAGQL